MEVMILLLDTLAVGLVCLWLRQLEGGLGKRPLAPIIERTLRVLDFRTGPDPALAAKLARNRRGPLRRPLDDLAPPPRPNQPGANPARPIPPARRR
jgi:hypothetical protein